MLDALRSRLWIRLAGLFIVAAALPMGGGWFAVGLLEEVVRQDAEQRQVDLARLAGELVRGYVKRGEEKLTTVSNLMANELFRKNITSNAFINGDYQETVARRLMDQVEPPDLYLEVQYFANTANPTLLGQVQQSAYAQAQQLRPDNDVLNEAQIALNSQNPIVLEPLDNNRNYVGSNFESNSGYLSLPLSVPVGGGERSLGALVAYLDVRGFEDLFNAVAGETYFLTLFDGNEEILSTGSNEDENVGQTVATGYANWSVRIEEPRRRVEETLISLRRQASWWIGLAVTLSLGFSLGLSAWILRPIGVLTRTADDLGQGRLNARTHIRRKDEIGALAAAFDRMAAELEQLDEAKSEFVANVSHELRTPLTSIRLSIANLLDGVVGDIDSRQQSTLERLSGDVTRMIRMVNDLLEIAKLEAGEIQPKRQSLDLAQLTAEAVTGLEPLANQKAITLHVDGSGSMNADRSMIHRVLTNLLDNAIKFTPREGRIEISICEGRLTVTDSGPGLDKERAFEKFVQGRQDGVKNPGVGLGLSIVKKLVDLHGGSIDVESPPRDAETGTRIAVTVS